MAILANCLLAKPEMKFRQIYSLYECPAELATEFFLFLIVVHLFIFLKCATQLFQPENKINGKQGSCFRKKLEEQMAALKIRNYSKVCKFVKNEETKENIQLK